MTANDKTLPRFAVTPIAIEGLENLRCLQLQQDFLQQATGYDREKRKRTSRFDPYSTISIHFPQTNKTRFYNLHGQEMCKGGSDLRMCKISWEPLVRVCPSQRGSGSAGNGRGPSSPHGQNLPTRQKRPAATHLDIEQHQVPSGLVTNSTAIPMAFTVKDFVFKKCVFFEHRVKVCVGCFLWCPHTSTLSVTRLSLFLCSFGSNARGQVEDP